MKLSAQITFWASLVFAVLCVAYGAFGFSETGDMPASIAKEDAYGYSWFWMFLGAIGLVFAGVSKWMMRPSAGDLDG